MKIVRCEEGSPYLFATFFTSLAARTGDMTVYKNKVCKVVGCERNDHESYYKLEFERYGKPGTIITSSNPGLRLFNHGFTEAEVAEILLKSC